MDRSLCDFGQYWNQVVSCCFRQGAQHSAPDRQWEKVHLIVRPPYDLKVPDLFVKVIGILPSEYGGSKGTSLIPDIVISAVTFFNDRCNAQTRWRTIVLFYI